MAQFFRRKKINHQENYTEFFQEDNRNILISQYQSKGKQIFGQTQLNLPQQVADPYELAKTFETKDDVTGCSLKEALYYYEIAAINGNDLAQLRLGNAYLKGELGLKRDGQKAVNYYKLAADQDNAEAQYKLAELYQNGEGVELSLQQAFKYYLLAAQKNLAEAEYMIGVFYQQGKIVEKSLEKAFRCYKLAANRGYREAQYAVAKCYETGEGVQKSHYQALKYLNFLSKKGYAPAQHYLGNLCFEAGNSKKAYKYYKSAADQGYEDSLYALGKCYQLGYGIEESWDESEKYYQLAAQKGYTQAFKSLTDLKVLRDLKKAADQGDIEAQLQLGEYYDRGLHAKKKSTRKACEYYQLAARQGNKQAQYLTGECYRIGGWDFKASWEDALVYYKLAAQQGHIEAIRLLFDCYHYGKGVLESQEEALKYLKLGAELNDPECQFQLGWYYANGLGNLTTSIVEEFKYIKLAANQGHPYAIKNLKNIGRILHPQAQEVNIQSYLQDQNISTLEAILKRYESFPIFLEKSHYSWEEAQVICDAMIENSRFTFMCPQCELERLFLAFELKGYHKEKDLKFDRLVNPSTEQETYGCVFIGNDIRDDSLKFR